MEIAVLGWGSLIPHPEKNERRLETKGEWNENGPLLPIEYARISGTDELTLVLYPMANNVDTLWAYSSFTGLDKAIENLRSRERTNVGMIGYYNKTDGSNRCKAVPETIETIRAWAEDKEIDAVIWTDLPENFEEKDKGAYTEDKAIEYLKELIREDQDKAEKARIYIQETPAQVVTHLRPRIRQEIGW